ncbi:MAG: SPOR domain-containing protein, partial [Noviherbaspirillum sp.]
MLKFLVGGLLAANVAMFAVQLGQPAGHEPARMNNQLHPERIRLLPESAAGMPAAAPAVAAPAPPEAQAGAAPLACIELFSFSAAEAARFEARMDALGLAGRLSRREIPTPANYLVMLPPQGSR